MKNKFRYEIILPHSKDPERMEDTCNPISDLSYTLFILECDKPKDFETFIDEKDLMKTVRKLYDRNI
jgi:hypothetical protein